MGCGCTYACLDCKKIYYVGYGLYGSWIYADTVAEFDARARRVVGAEENPWTEDGGLRKNQNIRTVLLEHAGHQLSHWIDDYEWGEENGTIYGMGSYGTRGPAIIEDVASFERINLWE